MKLHRLFWAAIIVVALMPNLTFSQFYYSGGRSLPLKIDSSKICVKFEIDISQDNQANILDSISRFVSVLQNLRTTDSFLVCSLSVDQGYDDFLDSIQDMNAIRLVEPYYLTTLDSVFLVGDRFCVAFDASMGQTEIDSINSYFGTTIQYEIEGMANVFVLLNNPSTGYRMLDLANEYYELLQTRYSHPIFALNVEQHSYNLFDYYNSYQGHIKKVIGQFNTVSVWDFAGLVQSNTVAVLDDGISDDTVSTGLGAHEDLPGNRVLTGMNFANTQLTPRPGVDQYHGMACSGIIGASHTIDSLAGLDSSSGVISLAPNVDLLPIKIFFDNGNGVGFDTIAAAITYAWQNGADVLSNSWGIGTLSCSQAGGNYQLDLITDAVESAFFLGRGGKGCPVIFSAGNLGLSYVRYPGCLSSAISVGAVKLNDSLWSYSHYGDGLDLVAPSGAAAEQGDVFSTDQPGKNGVNHPGGIFNCQPGLPIDGDYICNFGGTSAAAPIVAGIAVLVLSKDSNLTASEVYMILDSSAVTQLATDTITPPDFYYGWGRVDAFRAILSISRGDLNNDGQIGTILDLNFLVNRIFRGGPFPFPSPGQGDCNCDGTANNIVDLNYLVQHTFHGGPPPKNPCFKF